MKRARATNEIRVKVLVVGTSVNFRRIVSEAAEAQWGVRLMGTALDTTMALSKLERMEIDVILMDAAPAILQEESLLVDLREKFPQVIPIVISDLVGFTTEQEMRIIELGALDFIRKPAQVASEEWGKQLSRELGPLLEHCRRCIASRKPGMFMMPCSRQGLRQLKREFADQDGNANSRSQSAVKQGASSGKAPVLEAPEGTGRPGEGAMDRRERQSNRSLIPVRVLVVDRDLVFQRVLAKIVTALPGIELVVGSQNSAGVITLLENADIDVIILDKDKRDSVGAHLLDRVYTDYPHVIPIVLGELGSSAPSEVKRFFEHGALDYVNKPTGAPEEEWADILSNDFVPLLQHCQRCVYQRKHLGQMRRCTRRGLFQLKEEYRRQLGGSNGGRKPATVSSQPESTADKGGGQPAGGRRGAGGRLRKVDLVVIGVSTGGPGALRHVIPKLEKDLSVPVLLVIHLPELFTSRLAEALDTASKIKVVEGQDGQHLESGKVFLAPGGVHMSVMHFAQRTRSDRYEIKLLNTPHVNGCRPSVDVTLDSVARIRDCNVLTVIMTGMGADGANGVAQIKAGGGYSITQTKETCVIYGMPYAVDRKGLSDESVDLDDIGERINKIVKMGYPVRRSVPTV